MTDSTRHEILSRLERLSELAPDLRFGQLIANLAFMAADPGIKPCGTWRMSSCSRRSDKWSWTCLAAQPTRLVL